jgi:hypothetical protein
MTFILDDEDDDDMLLLMTNDCAPEGFQGRRGARTGQRNHHGAMENDFGFSHHQTWICDPVPASRMEWD